MYVQKTMQQVGFISQDENIISDKLNRMFCIINQKEAVVQTTWQNICLKYDPYT